MVIRDDQGLVIASLVHQICQAYKLIEIEAVAATWALEFGLEIGIDKVVVEGDSITVVSAMEKDDVGLAPFRFLVKDGIGFAHFFSQLTYSHTKREGNKVAHSLAMLAINYLDYVVWMEDVPPQVRSIILADLPVLSW